MACVFRVVRPILNVNLKSSPLKTIHSHGLSTKRCIRSVSTFSKWKVSEKCCLQSSSALEPVVTKGTPLRTFCTDKKLTLEHINDRVLKVCNTYDKIIPNQATLDSHFMNDLGLDSLDHVELIMNMEDEFNVQNGKSDSWYQKYLEISDSDAEKMLRPKDIVNFLVMKLQPEGCVQ